MHTVTISSIATESTFCFHHETGILFDCGEGASILLGDKVDQVKYVYLSDNRAENINGLKSLLQRNKNISVRFPIEFNGTFAKLQNELKNLGVWAGTYNDDIKQLDANLFVRTFRSYRMDIKEMCYSSVILEKKKKLKDKYKGLQPQDVAQIKATGEEVTELVATETFAYSPGVGNPKFIGAAPIIVAGGRNTGSVFGAKDCKKVLWTRLQRNEWHESIVPCNKEIPIPPIYIPHEFRF